MNEDSVDVAVSMPALGELIDGKYLVEEVIGEGGMGIVFRVTHVDLGRPLAVKVVREELARNDEVVERMLREARTAARLRSEHVTQVLDVGRLPSGAPFIVMECLEGQDAYAFLVGHGRLPFEHAASIVLEACEAVAEAHALGVVHRDLKPENLFLAERADGSSVVKVLDFGISKNIAVQQRRALTNPTTALGSPNYMSPEQMRPGSAVDGRADIWSLGAVLFELIAGEPPFEADTIPGVCARVLGEEPTSLRERVPEIPERLEAIVQRCLQKDPARRFQTVAEFAKVLGPYGLDATREYAGRVERVAAGTLRQSSHTPLPVTFRPPSATLPSAAAFSRSPSSGGLSGGQRRERSRYWLLLAAAICISGSVMGFTRFGRGGTAEPPAGAGIARVPAGRAAAPSRVDPSAPRPEAPTTQVVPPPEAHALPAGAPELAAPEADRPTAEKSTPTATSNDAASRRRAERRRAAAKAAAEAAEAKAVKAPASVRSASDGSERDPARFGGRF